MKPLAVRMRPKSLDEFLGQKKIIYKNSPLYNLINEKSKQSVSLILYGPAGTGKTTLAYLVAKNSDKKFVELSAVNATVKDVRNVIDEAKKSLTVTKKETVLFIDEVHRFSKSQQDVLLPAVENKYVVLIASTTENPSFSVISPLLSRSLLVKLEKLSDDDVKKLVSLAIESKDGLNKKVSISKDGMETLVAMANGDARKALTILEAASEVAKKITGKTISEVINIAALKYDKSGDEHYDVISAFIKSVRGSDVDAALHYLTRMITGGEDPRFIARRLIILSSEDIGLADSNALTVATNALLAVEKIGMPEAGLTLAHATIYLSTSPKSNSVYRALSKASSDIESGNFNEVPKHLRDAHYSGAKKLGHGLDYVYAHDEKHNIAKQQYAPDKLKNTTYYEPSENGFEKSIKMRLDIIKKLLK